MRWCGQFETLADANAARRVLWVLCRHCGHVKKLQPRRLMTVTDETKLADVQRKLRCERCRQRRAIIIVNDVEEPGMD
jgi:hypothetical protein